MLLLSVTKLTVILIPALCADCQPLPTLPLFQKEDKFQSLFSECLPRDQDGSWKWPSLGGHRDKHGINVIPNYRIAKFLNLFDWYAFINPQSAWNRWSGPGLNSPPLGWTWASQQPLSTSSTRSFSRYWIVFPVFPILTEQVIILICWLLFSFFKDSKTFQKEQEPPSPPEPPKPPVIMTSFTYLMYVWGIVQF